MKPTLSVSETMKILGVSQFVVLRAVARGELRSFRLGKTIRIFREEVERLIGRELTPDALA